MRHSFETMGTVVSLELPGADAAASAIAAVERLFADADARFSLYRPGSELSLVASGAIALTEASSDLRAAYADALEWSLATGGAFTPHRPDGVTDLNGIVKARAIAAAGAELAAAGLTDWSINAGGDALTSGAPSALEPWSVGVVDPANRAAVLCAVHLASNRRAIATSGSAERGDHIWLAGSIEPAEFVQVTVIADTIVAADVLATSIVAGGREVLSEVTARWDADVLTVDREGAMLATPGFRAALAVDHRAAAP